MAKNVSKIVSKNVVENVTAENITPIEVKVKKTFRFYKAGKDIDLSVKLPPQAKAILTFMKETNFRGTGPAIIDAMIEKGLIQTRQEPAVLFAFYARKLESVGLIRE